MAIIRWYDGKGTMLRRYDGDCAKLRWQKTRCYHRAIFVVASYHRIIILASFRRHRTIVSGFHKSQICSSPESGTIRSFHMANDWHSLQSQANSRWFLVKVSLLQGDHNSSAKNPETSVILRKSPEILLKNWCYTVTDSILLGLRFKNNIF